MTVSNVKTMNNCCKKLLTTHCGSSRSVSVCFVSQNRGLRRVHGGNVRIGGAFLAVGTGPALTASGPTRVKPISCLFYYAGDCSLRRGVIRLAPVVNPGAIVVPLLGKTSVTRHVRGLLPGGRI